MQTLTTAFPNDKTFQEVYGECMEHEPCVTSAVTDSYKAMGNMFDDYFNAVREHMFRFAYQCGYEAGVKAVQENRTGEAGA